MSINGSTGAFTYTPTVTARQNAGRTGATSADKADAFNVTITDGYGGSVAVPVNVAVSPALALNYSATISVGNNPVFAVASRDGARLYVSRMSGCGRGVAEAGCASPGALTVIDTNRNSSTYNMVVANYSLPDGAGGLVVSPDGRRVYASTNNGVRAVTAIDTSTGSVIARVPVQDAPAGIAISPDGKRVYVTNRDSAPGVISVIDSDPGSGAYNTVVGRIPVPGGLQALAVSQDGSRAYATGTWGAPGFYTIDTTINQVISRDPSGLGDVLIFPDGHSHFLVREVNLSLTYGGASLSSDGKLLFRPLVNGGVVVTESASGNFVANSYPTASLDPYVYTCYSLTASANGSVYTTDFGNGNVNVFSFG